MPSAFQTVIAEKTGVLWVFLKWCPGQDLNLHVLAVCEKCGFTGELDA
jgi:hypothetical protein